MFGFKNVLCLLAITLLALGGMVAGHDDHGHGVEVLSSYGGLPALGYTGEVQ